MKIVSIAKNTFRECVRYKVLYNLVIFGVLIILSSLLLGSITIGDVRQVIVNLGLSTLSIFGILIAIFIGIQLVYKEIDKKTIYSLLAKPVARYEFILGKYCGLTLTLMVNVAVMLLGIYAAIFYLRRSFDWIDLQILWAGALILIQLMLVIAIALFFSTFSTPAFSALFAFSLYVVGHFSSDIRQYGFSSHSSLIKSLANFSYYLLPNFQNFGVIAQTANGQFPSSHMFFLSALYGLVYSMGLVALAILIFQRRDFK